MTIQIFEIVDSGINVLTVLSHHYCIAIPLKGLFTSLAETYTGGGICFDARNEVAVFNTNKFIEKSGYSSTCHLAVNSARQKFSEWSDKFAAVSTFRRLPEDVRNAASIPFTIRQEMAFAMKMGYFKIIEIGFAGY